LTKTKDLIFTPRSFALTNDSLMDEHKPPKLRPDLFVISVIMIALLPLLIFLAALGYLLASYLFGRKP